MSVLRARLERKADGVSLLVGETRLLLGERLTGLLECFHEQEVEIAVPAHDVSLGSAGDNQCILAKGCCEMARYFLALAGMKRSLFRAASSRKRSWS
jgi:hypothetical protein